MASNKYAHIQTLTEKIYFGGFEGKDGFDYKLLVFLIHNSGNPPKKEVLNFRHWPNLGYPPPPTETLDASTGLDNDFV